MKKSITLCAVTSANLELTHRALMISANKFDFDDVLLVTDSNEKFPYRVEKSPKFADRQANWEFMWSHLPNLIKTDYLLFVQYDGYIIDSSMWCDYFYKYDLIGAKWPFHKTNNVGNGGFCLRSRKLIEMCATYENPKDHPEDDYVCRKLRPELEKNGIVFAPESVADRFSYERHLPDNSTFGFHGLFNMWRHVDDSEMLELMKKLAPYVIKSHHFDELILTYWRQRKFDLCKKMIEYKESINDAA